MSPLPQELDTTVRPVRGSWPPACALVTGASGGIGAAMTRALLGAGGTVLASGRSPGGLAEHAAAGAQCLPADLTGDGVPETLVTAAVERLGGLDLLVAAAGVGAAGALTDLDPRSTRALLDLDLTSVVLLVQAALPHLITSRGRVVLIGSVSGALAPRGEAVYAAAKAGLAAFADALRSELADSGVSVTLVLPGIVDTGFFASRGTPAPSVGPRPRSPEEVARRALAAAERRRATVWVPRWLDPVARFRGVAPRIYHRLADALGAHA